MLSIRRIGEGGAYTLSVLLTGLVVGNAFHQKKQFYPAVVYLTKSSPSLAVLAVQAFIFVVLLGKLTRKIFFGTLRAAEMEHLVERSWYAVTETCLAFTVFRDDFNAMFVAMFTMLLFFKCFHWLAEDRVDYMERSPLLGFIFHTRILGLLTSLAIVDCLFMRQAYLTTIVKGASAQLVFGFEYAILLTIVFTVLVKYMLHCIDLYDENPWENKAVYLLYLELITSGWKFLLYIVFVTIMSKVHTLPLFAIRPLYLTMRSFKKALTDVILSRRAIRNMNQLYPNATEEDLQSVDDCIICREPMHAQGGCKKLPCSHIFHASCLRSWFQRQQTCPTCRMEVLSTRPAAPAAPAARAALNAARNAAPAAGQVPPMANPWGAFQPAQVPPPLAAQAPQAPNQQAPVPPYTPFNPAFPQPANGNQPNGAGSNTNTPTMPTQLPTMPAFPPFMGMPPFMAPPPPPPMPQANLSTLSDEQLRDMERDERSALESRVQWLRDIQTLLDSAVEQMHQYTQVMSALNASRVPLASANQSTAHTQPPQTASSGTTPAGEPQQSATAAVSQPTTLTSEALGGARPKTISSDSAPPDSPTQGAQNTQRESTTPTDEEVRQRRIARFEQSGGDA